MVALAVSQNSATRNVYIGNLPENITEDELFQDLSKFGPIDIIKLIPEKNIGFVHFLNIATALKVVQQFTYEDISANPEYKKWSGRKVFYGKDRCAYISKTQQQNAAQYLGIAPGYEHLLATADRELISSALAQQSAAAVAVATAAGGPTNVGNRTLYLGSVHPETTIEEICNVVRGGLLHNVRYIPEKHICFITFVDPTAAAQFYALATLQSLAIHNRRLKIGWGKHSGPLPQALAMAVAAGASRNVYIGNIDENWPESKLRHDFSEFGEIEQINFLPEKTCAFVNFTNLANAIKAIDGIKEKEEYQKFKINFGKDRCANPSRQLVQQPNQVQGSTSSQSRQQQQSNSSGQYHLHHSPSLGQYPPSAAAAVALAAAASAAMAPGGPLLSSAMGAASLTPNSPPQMDGTMATTNMISSPPYQQSYPYQNLQMMELLRNGGHVGNMGLNSNISNRGMPVHGLGVASSSSFQNPAMMSMMSTLSSSRSSPGILSPIEEGPSTTSPIPGFQGSGYRAPNFANDTSTTITIPEEEEEEEEEKTESKGTEDAEKKNGIKQLGAATASLSKQDKSPSTFTATENAGDCKSDSEKCLLDSKASVESNKDSDKDDSDLTPTEEGHEQKQDESFKSKSLPSNSDTQEDVDGENKKKFPEEKVEKSRDYKVIDQATAAATAADVAQVFGL